MKKKSTKEKKLPSYALEEESKKETASAIRHHYVELGVEGYYSSKGSEYINPHEERVREILKQGFKKWTPPTTRVLDLACGSGEVTLILRELGVKEIEGMDPYTCEAFEKRTKLKCKSISFEDITQGKLGSEKYSLVVCSYAMHLASEGLLPVLCMQLAMSAETLIIITPHKRPEISSEWGWDLVEEIKYDKTKARYYKSSLFSE